MYMLKQLLSCTTALTDLTLQLPISQSNLLRSLRFRNLYLFKTNIPHRAVADFLRRHPHIGHLELGPCNFTVCHNACPLKDVNFPTLWDIACPLACATVLQPAGLIRARMLHHNIRDTQVLTSQVLGGALFSSATLTVLQLDFDADDFGLLRCISRAAPLLATLKLVENRHVKMPVSPVRLVYNCLLLWLKHFSACGR